MVKASDGGREGVGPGDDADDDGITWQNDDETGAKGGLPKRNHDNANHNSTPHSTMTGLPLALLCAASCHARRGSGGAGLPTTRSAYFYCFAHGSRGSLDASSCPILNTPRFTHLTSAPTLPHINSQPSCIPSSASPLFLHPKTPWPPPS